MGQPFPNLGHSSNAERFSPAGRLWAMSRQSRARCRYRSLLVHQRLFYSRRAQQRAGWPFAAEMIGMAAGEIEKEAVVQQLVAHPAIERSRLEFLRVLLAEPSPGVRDWDADPLGFLSCVACPCVRIRTDRKRQKPNRALPEQKICRSRARSRTWRVAGWYWLNKSSGSIIKSFRDMGVKNRNHPSELELAAVQSRPSNRQPFG
jgi:hypothetical protein